MNNGQEQRTTLRARSVFISDIHLGFKGCQAQYLLDFLRRVECEQIYLVGDIIDLWALSKSFYWPQAHNDVIRTILGKAKHGTRVVYIPGNHDRVFRDHDGLVHGQRRDPARGHPHRRPTAAASWCCTATSSTASCARARCSSRSAATPMPRR